jgi:hypothetical protein
VTRRSGMGRSKRLAAAVATGGLLLVPAALTFTGVRIFHPIAAADSDPGALPGAGDLLAAVRRAYSRLEDYGAGGKLPESDTLSPGLLAALASPDTGAGAGGRLATVPPGPLGIPGVMLDAYMRAERTLAVSYPNCGLHWSVLAAIGRIESSHAYGGAVDAQGNTLGAILGPQLSGGPGIAAIRDSDGGVLDGDRVWDRAVGPMQFIPTTWARYAADGTNDGIANPHNIYDAALAAGRFLCAGGGDLRDPVQLAQAVFRYNHSEAYVANVLAWAAAYATGVTPLPSSPVPIEQQAGGQPPTVPPTTTPPGTTLPPTTTSPTGTTTSPTPTTSPTGTTPPSTTTPTCPTTPTGPTQTTTSTPTSVPPGCETTTPPTIPPTSGSSTTPNTESTPASSTATGSSTNASSSGSTSSTTTSLAAT